MIERTLQKIFERNENYVSFCNDVVEEISNLLDMNLQGQEFNCNDYSTFLSDLSTLILKEEHLQGESKGDYEIALGLTGKNDQKSVNRFVNSVAQVVGLEYGLTERETDEKNVLIPYIKGVKKLDEILSQLTKGYCATNCEYGSSGCCDFPHYSKDVSTTLIALQRIEAKKNGRGIVDKGEGVEEAEKRCKYHSDTEGCALILTKSPVCLGYICEGLINQSQTMDPHTGLDFVASMDNICKGSLVKYEGFTLINLERAIKYGQELVSNSIEKL